MHEYETWLDLTCLVGETRQTVCTLFARHAFPVRPLAGERVSFLSRPDRPAGFTLVEGVGHAPQHHVATEVVYLSHGFAPSDHGALASTSLRLADVDAASLDDARAIVDFLSREYGFTIDPHGPDLLKAEGVKPEPEPAADEPPATGPSTTADPRVFPTPAPSGR